jgi:tetratricopeptide (TPR) repeat protein
MGFKMVKKIIIFILAMGLVQLSSSVDSALAATTKRKTVKKSSKGIRPVSKKMAPPKKAAAISGVKSSNAELQQALSLAKSGNYEEASLRLFNLSRSPRYTKERMQIKYLLGLMLYDMKMYQAAAFHFVDVVRDGNSSYIKKSLEKLSLAADQLGDVTLLNYAISKVELNDFPIESQDMLRYRIGEYQFRNGELNKAAASFSAVEEKNPLYGKSKYMEALCYATQNKNEMAIRSFNELLSSRNPENITDTTRVAALMGLARAHYQNKEWEQGMSYYRQVPRDTEFYHDALFEISWAQMRAAQFRSVLGNMHSLHSPYYEDFYIPESLLLRSLVYMYICQYDEMDKTLDLFEKIYQPVRKDLVDIIKSYNNTEKYYKEIEKVIVDFDKYKKDMNIRKNSGIPFIVARKIMRETDFKKSYDYIRMLENEKKMIDEKSSKWRASPLGMYAKKVLTTRSERARENTGVLVKKYIVDMHKDLLELFKQHDFARFEMLNGKKDQMKKKMMKPEVENAKEPEEENRNFYIQNGYEYWPFQGEYWLDEIGNYYYLGKSRCE